MTSAGVGGTLSSNAAYFFILRDIGGRFGNIRDVNPACTSAATAPLHAIPCEQAPDQAVDDLTRRKFSRRVVLRSWKVSQLPRRGISPVATAAGKGQKRCPDDPDGAG